MLDVGGTDSRDRNAGMPRESAVNLGVTNQALTSDILARTGVTIPVESSSGFTFRAGQYVKKIDSLGNVHRVSVPSLHLCSAEPAALLDGKRHRSELEQHDIAHNNTSSATPAQYIDKCRSIRLHDGEGR